MAPENRDCTAMSGSGNNDMDDYRSTAAFYDRCLTPLLNRMRADIRTYVQHRGYRKIIDICCGTGDQLQLLENSADELVGIDNSPAMLARARQNCSDNVALHLADAEQLEFPDGYFDCSIISFSLHEKHETIRDLIFSSARRVIRQGGSLIVCDYSGNPSGFKGFFLGNLIIPIIERFAGRLHYRNYLSWMRHGGLEIFLQHHHQTADIISRRFGTAALCCAVARDDELRAYRKHIALLNQSLPTPTFESEPRS